jgi:hypothetical protein
MLRHSQSVLPGAAHADGAAWAEGAAWADGAAWAEGAAAWNGARHRRAAGCGTAPRVGAGAANERRGVATNIDVGFRRTACWRPAAREPRVSRKGLVVAATSSVDVGPVRYSGQTRFQFCIADRVAQLLEYALAIALIGTSDILHNATCFSRRDRPGFSRRRQANQCGEGQNKCRAAGAAPSKSHRIVDRCHRKSPFVVSTNRFRSESRLC